MPVATMPRQDLASEFSSDEAVPENLGWSGSERKRIIPDAIVITGQVLDERTGRCVSKAQFP